MKTVLLFCIGLLMSSQSYAGYWQQHVDYKMEIDFDVRDHRFSGKQWLTYTNHSPDTLHRVFYHLYFNAFQPGSMMDVRAQTMIDGDQRIASRLPMLKPDEIGYHKVHTLTQEGDQLSYEIVGTILEVKLAHPILPGASTDFYMEFDAQVPVQIRRSGRDNAEGIAYSMSQWYPKLCAYDHMGWHANPYIAREFYGEWGDFDVTIRIDRDYTIGATGYLQNPEEIGHGYTDGPPSKRNARDKILKWHFVAENVHDFVWGADPEYVHTRTSGEDGLVFECFYKNDTAYAENWEQLPGIMHAAMRFINRTFGQYPYRKYAFIQGGDGGMEYPMATLITGNRSLRSLVGVAVHELMHSWYQMVLATNESLYAWMDEGFTSYASVRVIEYLKEQGLLPGEVSAYPFRSRYLSYANISQSGYEEPLTTHADHFSTNTAYGSGAYTKGAIFLHQLEYIVGKEAFDRGLIKYFNTWKFKHPTPNDFIRVMEKTSGLELDWYKEYWIYTTKTIDYALDTIYSSEPGKTAIVLEKTGEMPMPIDIAITLQSGEVMYYNIPLRIMRGVKKEARAESWTVAEDWPWTYPSYELIVPVPLQTIENVVIDPTYQMADIDWKNNSITSRESNP